ncbi:aldehyde dehydrogenase family protein [soil metagenome]
MAFWAETREAAETAGSPEVIVGRVLERARAALAAYENRDQGRVDEAVTALAWSIYKPENAHMLAELAVEDTGLGTVESKIIKNTRKTFGTLRDLLRARTVGVIDEDPARGLVKYGKPVGIVAAVCPSTNPAATPVNKAMMALKGGNAVVIAPSPAGYATTARTVELMRAELAKAGFPPDLVQILPAPVSKETTQSLMAGADLAVVTGSQDNVRRAMASGTVASGVGAGNVPVIVDATADLDDAAGKITASKIFDNATSCSSENAVVLLDDIYEPMMAAFARQGGHRASPEEKAAILGGLWVSGKLNRRVIARDMDVLAGTLGLSDAARAARFVLVEDDRPGRDRPLADEKLSLILPVYRARDFDHALALVRDILEVKGKGHSCGIHTADMDHAQKLAEETDVVRVLVNQAHTFGNGGSFNNALPFTLSMGGGTWAKNSISENLNHRHFINITHLVTTIPEDKPTEEELFGPYWAKHGK